MPTISFGNLNGSLRSQSRATLSSSSPSRNDHVQLGDGLTQKNKSGSWSYLMLLVPIFCCGWPFIVLAVGPVGAVTLGIVGSVIAALVAGICIFVAKRRKLTRCCSGSLFEKRQ